MAIDNPIRMKDVLGHTVLISQAELLAALTAAKTLLVFGMDIEAILALRTKYIEAGGALPITSAAIQTVINPTREEDPCP